MAERRKPTTRTSIKATDVTKTRRPTVGGLTRQERRERAAHQIAQREALAMFEAGAVSERLRELKVGDRLTLAVEAAPLYVALHAVEIVGETERVWKLAHGITLLKESLRSPNPSSKAQTYLSAHPESLTGRYLAAEAGVQELSRELLSSAGVLMAYAPVAVTVRENADAEVDHLEELTSTMRTTLVTAYELADQLRKAVQA